MIEVNNLSVSIEKNIILNDLTFTLTKDVLCILGLNGVGKTTLLKTIAGLNKSYNGDIMINQRSINSYSSRNLAKSISFVPQEHVPYFNFTVKELVMFGRTPHIRQFGFPTKTDYDFVENILCEMGLDHLKKRYYIQLSGGEKRLVLIAAALAQETQIILLDEPIAFLDLKNAIIVISKIKKLAREAKKILIVTIHDINLSMSFSEYTLLLYSRDYYEFGKTNSIINEKNLRKLYGMKFNTIYSDNNRYFIPSE